MRPLLALIMDGTTARATMKAAVKFTVRTRSQSSRFIRIRRPSRVIPALFTR